VINFKHWQNVGHWANVLARTDSDIRLMLLWWSNKRKLTERKDLEHDIDIYRLAFLQTDLSFSEKIFG